jgi:hypothetical protein
MSSIIAYFVAGICGVAFVTIWFRTVYKELSAARNGLAGLEEQMLLHERLSGQTRDGPGANVAAGMLETSRMLYHEAAKDYNRILRKPMNRLPALLMGFRVAQENPQGEGSREK